MNACPNDGILSRFLDGELNVEDGAAQVYALAAVVAAAEVRKKGQEIVTLVTKSRFLDFAPQGRRLRSAGEQLEP